MPKDYWELTYDQFRNCLDGYDKRLEEQVKIADALNHSLGKYFRAAMSSKTYPDKPFLVIGSEHSSGITNDEAYDKYIDSQIRKQGK